MEHPAGAPAARTRSTRRRLSAPRWRPLTEGAPLILPLVAAGIAATRIYPLAAPLAFLAAGGVALAFRDPERAVEQRADIAVAPADGQVIHVGRAWDEHWETELAEVSIFLALWDVHVQRSPLAGEIVAQRRYSGGYRPAMSRAATHGNNRFATYLWTQAGPCTVTQISGLVARRIVTWACEGDRVEQGERLGMIKFGSQVTIRLPLSSTVLVKPGDAVRAGLTPVARLALAEAHEA